MSSLLARPEQGDAELMQDPAGHSAQRPHVVVIGGGISGLSAAHRLAGSEVASNLRLTVLESGERFGGKIRTIHLDGRAIDVGAESLMLRTPEVLELCRELGLESELIEPATMSTAVFSRGALRTLPPGILGGLPGGARSVLRSGILSPSGVLRAAFDLALPAVRLDDDRSVSDLIGRRLGKQALERLVEPLLGTIYAAGCDQLSLRATAPQLEAMARSHRSLLLAARAGGQKATKPGPPPFRSLSGGLSLIVERLQSALSQSADLRTNAHVRSIERSERQRGFRVGFADTRSGQSHVLAADVVLLATPARSSAQALSGLYPDLAAQLNAVRSAAAIVVTLRYAPGCCSKPPAGAGILIPAGSQGLLGACTVLSNKWPQLGESGELWLRCSVGRAALARAQAMPDAELLAAVHAELERLLAIGAAPAGSHVQRWAEALPIYEPGHLERVGRIERTVAGIDGLELAGAAYRGIGVPNCIAQGWAAAERISAALSMDASDRAIAAI